MCNMSLEEKIADRTATVGIVGLGYVGLPMASLFAKAGFPTVGVDINPDIVDKVNKGICPINEEGLPELVASAIETGRLVATTNGPKVLPGCDIIITVVQTPIHEDKTPNLSALEGALSSVAQSLRKDQLVIVESTIPPGSTHDIIIPILESSGLRAGEDFYLAYSPERAIPTNTLKEIQTNDRLVGGVSPESAQLARELYSNITSGDLLLGDIPTVEVVKVIENTFRDVNIALANEIALFCEGLGIDAMKAIEMANRHPRVNLHMPGPGVGGHCIPKDPYFLIKKAEEMGLELRVINNARSLNESMPGHILKKIETSLSTVGKTLEDSKVAVLGIAYKGNTDDIRSTPSEPIIKGLMKMDVKVSSHDPYVSQDFGSPFSNDITEAVEGVDCVVVATDHDEYKELDLKELAKHMNDQCVIVDGRRLWEPEMVKQLGLGYFGIGY